MVRPHAKVRSSYKFNNYYHRGYEFKVPLVQLGFENILNYAYITAFIFVILSVENIIGDMIGILQLTRIRNGMLQFDEIWK